MKLTTSITIILFVVFLERVSMRFLLVKINERKINNDAAYRYLNFGMNTPPQGTYNIIYSCISFI